MKYTVDIPENLRNNPSKVREAFQKAIDEANLSGGGTVYIPSGKYTVCISLPTISDYNAASAYHSDTVSVIFLYICLVRIHARL